MGHGNRLRTASGAGSMGNGNRHVRLVLHKVRLDILGGFGRVLVHDDVQDRGRFCSFKCSRHLLVLLHLFFESVFAMKELFMFGIR